MAKRGSYERRGNATESAVEARKSKHRPLSRREMESAFRAWKENKARGDTSISSAIIAGGKLSKWNERQSASEIVTHRRRDIRRY